MGVFVAAGKVGIGEGISVDVAASAGAQAVRSKKQRMYIKIFFIGFSFDHAAKIISCEVPDINARRIKRLVKLLLSDLKKS